MQYAILIYEKPGATDHLSPEEQEAITAEYTALAQDPACDGGAHLLPADATTTVRVADSQALITDGPFADTKEAMGGFFVWNADDLDTVLEVARKIPATRFGGAVEVRPIAEHPR